MRSRRRLTAFTAVGLIALSAMALSASSAQASGNGLFLINLANIGSFPNAISGSTTLDGEFLSIGLNVFCSASELSGSITNATHGKGTIAFSECVVSGGEDVCLIEHKGVPNGIVLSNPLLIELLLLGKLIRFSPLSGIIFAPVDIVSHDRSCTVIISPTLETIDIEGSVCADVSGDQIQFRLSSVHCALGIGGNPAEAHGPPVLVTSGTSKVTTHG